MSAQMEMRFRFEPWDCVDDLPINFGSFFETESYRRLVDRAYERSGAIPEELLALRVIEAAGAGDWWVRAEAMEATLRRLASLRRERVTILRRPAGERIRGMYEVVTERAGKDLRRYRCRVDAVAPIAGSCDCADFQKNALGLCKHLLAVLEHIYSKEDWLDRRECEAENHAARLAWNPIRPLDGPGDWLDAVFIERGSSGRLSMPLRRINSVLRLRAPHQPKARLRRVEMLLELLRSDSYRAVDPDPDPALLAQLDQERERLQSIVELGKLRRGLNRRLLTLRTKLYPYQVEGVRKFLSSGRLLIADDMGLGKTAQAIAIAHLLLRSDLGQRGVVVVPAPLKHQWLREWRRFTDVPARVVDGGPAHRRALYQQAEPGVLITSYGQLRRDVSKIAAFEPDLVILDEAQRIKNWATKTAMAAKSIDAPYRVVLTGTPMQNRLEELASIMDWIDERALAPKWRLVPCFMSQVGDGAGGICGVRNLKTIRTRLAPTMIRRVRQDVIDQLPARTDTVVPVPMTREQEEIHNKLDHQIKHILREHRDRALPREQFLRLMRLLTSQRIVSNGRAQLDFDETWPTIEDTRRPTMATLFGLSSPKLFELRELVEQLVIEQRRKVVVFSQWRRMLRLAEFAVRSILLDAGLRALFFTGAESPKLRERALVDFHDEDDVRVLFLSDAGGTGLNLQRAASACINLELPWNPAVLEQRVGRIYRLGQTEPIHVFNLVTETGIEARIAELIRDKEAMFTGLFDSKSDTVEFGAAPSLVNLLKVGGG